MRAKFLPFQAHCSINSIIAHFRNTQVRVQHFPDFRCLRATLKIADGDDKKVMIMIIHKQESTLNYISKKTGWVAKKESDLS